MKKSFLIIIIALFGADVKAQIKTLPPSVNDTTVYEYETGKTVARYKGGTHAFFEFVGKNLKFPQNGSGATGKVLISFIVEKNGTLTGFKIEKGIEKSFDAEALRVIKRSPKWIPARVNAKPVRSRYIVPISFIIKDN